MHTSQPTNSAKMSRRSYQLISSIVLLSAVYWQIQIAIAQQATAKPILRKHEQMCREYKKQVFEKVFYISNLVLGSPPIENRVDKCAPWAQFILGGEAAKPKEFPHMARLGYAENGGTNIKWFCGGTLISETWVLTAAHCFAQSEEVNRVRLGELDFSSTTDDATPMDFNVKDYHSHPNYTSTLDYYDIGLVELNGAVKFTEYIAPACLPIRNGNEFERFLAVGWGSTDFSGVGSDLLLKVTLDRYDGEVCNQYARRTTTLTRGLVEDEQLCAGSELKRDTCTGDSGGPLLQQTNLRCMYQVVGVTSTGPGCGLGPGIYTRVYNFIDWIEDMVWKN